MTVYAGYASQFLFEEVSRNQDWVEQIRLHEADLMQQLRTLMNHAREKEMSKF